MDHRGGCRSAGRLIRVRAAFFFVLLAWAASARAQPFESIGVRAQGMGGAFVAVSDDATAVWWNPAGLASGALFSAILERQSTSIPDDADAAARAGGPAEEAKGTGFAVAYPALGVSYYRVRIYQETNRSAVDTPSSNREDQGFAAVSLRSLAVSQYGATVGQSIGNHLVVSTTLKLVRGHLASEDVALEEGSLDRARALEGPGETHADLDVGVMARFGAAQLGLAVRNLGAPAFGDGANRMALSRRVRAGASATARFQGMVDSLTMAADVDLTENDTPFGRERRVAVGAEAWLWQRHVGIRGGLSASATGETPRSLSGGISLALSTGVYLEGFVMGRDVQGRHGWGSDLRLTF